MVFLFDLGGVLSDIDVQGFLNRLQRLMPEGGRAGLDPDVLLAGGGDSFPRVLPPGNNRRADTTSMAVRTGTCSGKQKSAAPSFASTGTHCLPAIQHQ